MTDLLVKMFIKDYKNTNQANVRTSYGILSSIVGVLSNLFLFGVKFVIGLLLNSIAVTADAFNNLSDAASSVIGFIGVKIASKPADKDHPFGHGRVEYIAALVVSFIVIEVGFTFLKDAIAKIREPEDLSFQLISVIILILSIGVKLWLGFFNRKLGRKINSKVMAATATDAYGDVIITSATIVSILIFHLTGYNIDGFVGLVVAAIVMYAGFCIAKDTLEPLIGEAVDPQVFKNIMEFVESYEGIEGCHDLLVHNYGPSRSMASIHAEVPNNTDIEISHEIIDRIERDALKQLGVFLVIHMDPIETCNDKILEIKQEFLRILSHIDSRITIHDFRVVDGQDRINLIFDMVVPHDYNEEKQTQLQKKLTESLEQYDQRYQCVITMEKSFVAEEKEEISW